MRAIAPTLELVPSPTAEALALIAELDEELNKDYPPEQRHGLSPEKLFRPEILFFIARLDGTPAGCGGVMLADDFGEVKRMYTRPSARGRGVAQAILERLEREAQARGIRRLVLETGDIRTAAIALYARMGFRQCGPFGPYLTMDPVAVQRSVFMEKALPSQAMEWPT
jgi:putative acetyltransferase